MIDGLPLKDDTPIYKKTPYNTIGNIIKHIRNNVVLKKKACEEIICKTIQAILFKVHFVKFIDLNGPKDNINLCKEI